MSTSIGRGVSQAVGLATVESSDLPPSGRLRDPLPRGLLKSPRAIGASPEWEAAMRGALDRCAHEAARPALEPVAGNANAVLFTDQSELLACLARDLLSGDAGLRWWWTALRRTLPADALDALDALVAAWCRNAAAVPAALDILTRTGTVQRILDALTAAQALTVVRAIAAAFEIPALLTLLTPGDAAELGAPEVADVAVAEPSPVAKQHGGRASLAAPWTSFIRDSVSTPVRSVERELLLGIGLTLARVPSLARSRGFVERVSHWWHTMRVDTPVELPESRTTSTARANETTAPAPTRVRDAATSAGPLSQEAVIGEPRSPEEAETAQAPLIEPEKPGSARAPTRSEQREQRDVSRPPGSESSGAANATSRQSSDSEQRLNLPHSSGLSRDDVPRRRAAVRSEIEQHVVVQPTSTSGTEPAWVATEIGGTFYLVTLLKSLDFFDDLERHFGLTEGPGAWGWVELLSRVLLGPRLPDHLVDPVWHCLAALDGREPGAPIGCSFQGADVYMLPRAWAPHLLTASSVATAHWLSRGRVQVWHPEGVVLQDPGRARDRRVTWQLGRQVRERRNLGLVGLPLDPELRRFLEFLVPFFRWRLTHAMRLESDRAIAGALLESSARVFVSATHVDVRFPLAAARTAVRMAGLDVNPGWVPALGRVVGFEYV